MQDMYARFLINWAGYLITIKAVLLKALIILLYEYKAGQCQHEVDNTVSEFKLPGAGQRFS